MKGFPGRNISPTLHKLLAHAAQLINDFNEGYGLEAFSEEGIEASNKLIRRFRGRLSRRFCFEDELRDIFTRLLDQSDPVLVGLRKTAKRDVLTEKHLSSYQKQLINALILNEGNDITV